jgi:hypothetical protein
MLICRIPDRFVVFNPHRAAAEPGVLSRILRLRRTARMCPARESRLKSGCETPRAFESRLPALAAAPLGVTFLCRQRKGTKKIFEILDAGSESGKARRGQIYTLDNVGVLIVSEHVKNVDLIPLLF